MPALFTLAVALGAALLFLIEPMAAKALLPWLGGSAAVWTVCLVFFQTTLLAGYVYAHLLARRLPGRRMVLVHGALVVLACLLLLWRGNAPAGPVYGPPALWILATLAASVGLPFFVLASTAPLLQRWFADLPGARDPYPLYAVSNAASVLGLLAYPLVVERYLPLAGFAGGNAEEGRLTQNALWSGAFLLYAALVGACASRVASAAPAPLASGRRVAGKRRTSAGPRGSGERATRAGPKRGGWWVFLAFVPTAAMLGTTQALTAEVAAVPLLWVVPLSVYLLTFVLAFARPALLPLRALSWIAAALALGVAATQWVSIRPHPHLALPLYLATLFAVGLLCHGRLARERPPAAELTGFYLAIAAGGALGSIFCGLVAPLVFRTIAEYQLALVLACLCRVAGWRESPGALGRRGPLLDLALVAAFVVGLAIAHLVIAPGERQDARAMHLEIGVACLLCALLAARTRAFAAALAVLFFMAARTGPMSGYDLLVSRSFFGVHRVKNAPGLPFAFEEGPNPRVMQLPMHELYHGATMHGVQLRTGDQAQKLPTAYFHPTGPIGRVITGLRARPGRQRLEQVGVVGLGVGTLAAYASPGERFTFFEIDREVVRIARDPALFSFLQDSAGTVETVLVDGRIGLAAQPDGHFDLIAMDAFSSDSIPVHLLTREALEIVLGKLRRGAVAAYHLSSSFFDLAPVIAEAAAALGKEGLFWYDQDLAPAALAVGKLPSAWVVVAASAADLEPLRSTGPWQPLSAQRRTSGGPWLWTDRYSSPLAALRR